MTYIQIWLKLKYSYEKEESGRRYWKVFRKVIVIKYLFGIITGFLEKLGFKIQLETDQKVALFDKAINVINILTNIG